MSDGDTLDWQTIAENNEKALRAMQARWSDMIEQSKQAVERARQGAFQFEAERDEALKALADIRVELSHGATANWEYIHRRFIEVLGDG